MSEGPGEARRADLTELNWTFSFLLSFTRLFSLVRFFYTLCFRPLRDQRLPNDNKSLRSKYIWISSVIEHCVSLQGTLKLRKLFCVISSASCPTLPTLLSRLLFDSLYERVLYDDLFRFIHARMCVCVCECMCVPVSSSVITNDIECR